MLGRRGCGKSTLAKSIQEVFPRKIIIDSLHEYDDGTVVNTFDEYCNALGSIAKTQPKEFKIVFRIEHDGHDSVEVVDHAARIAFELGDCLLVIEEIQLFATHHSLNRYLKNALLLGRHQNMALMFTSQRAGEVHKTILSQCNHIFVGQMHEKNDINYLKSFLGSSVEALPNFEVHSFLYFAQSGKITKIRNQL